MLRARLLLSPVSLTISNPFLQEGVFEAHSVLQSVPRLGDIFQCLVRLWDLRWWFSHIPADKAICLGGCCYQREKCLAHQSRKSEDKTEMPGAMNMHFMKFRALFVTWERGKSITDQHSHLWAESLPGSCGSNNSLCKRHCLWWCNLKARLDSF